MRQKQTKAKRRALGGVGLIVLVLLAAVLLVSRVAAHGATIVTTSEQATVVVVAATYDSGEPMANAAVTVYAPDDPTTAWATATTDATGYYTFVPDTQRPGTWEVTVRQAGHGGTIYVAVAADATVTATTTPEVAGYTPLQIVVMSAAVVWGFVGTALYFLRRPTA